MADYFVYVVSAAALSMLAGLSAFKADDKWYRFSVAIIVISSVISPLAELIGASDGDISIPEISPPAADGGEYERVAEESFSLGVARLIADKYGIGQGSVTVRVSGLRINEMRADKIEVSLSGEGLRLDSLRVKRYIEDSGLGECEVKYIINE